MTGKELYERLEKAYNGLHYETLDKWEELSETEQLVWERLAADLRKTHDLEKE